MKRYKKSGDFSYAIGVFPTLELLHVRPDCVHHILLKRCGVENGGIQQIEALCAQKRIHVEAADRAIDRISGSENAYAVAVFEKYCAPLQHGNHVVLVSPSDTGNLGTILRTAVAFDLQNLAIIRPAVDVFDPKTVRASMGALFRMNFAYFSDFAEYRSCFGNNLYAFMTNGSIPLPCAAFREPFSLVFGNEGAGLDAVFREIGQSIAIPQSCAVDSLNLSIAVGIALYASSYQRRR